MGELKNSVLIVREIMLYSEEIYTAGKNFTLPPAVMGWKILTYSDLNRMMIADHHPEEGVENDDGWHKVQEAGKGLPR